MLVKNSRKFRLIFDGCFKFVDFSWTYVVGWVFWGIIDLEKYQWAAQKKTQPTDWHFCWSPDWSLACCSPAEHASVSSGSATYEKVSGLAFCFCLVADQPVHPLPRCFPVERLPWSVLEYVLHPDNLFGGCFAGICAFRPEIPNQAIGVLIGSPLPRTVRVAEVDLYLGIHSELLVLSHFLAPIIGQW